MSTTQRLAHLDAVKRHLINEILTAYDEGRPADHLRRRLLTIMHARTAIAQASA